MALMSPLRFAASFVWEIALGTLCFLALLYGAYQLRVAVEWFEQRKMNRGMIVVVILLECHNPPTAFRCGQ
jgi:hypothetical protein